MFMVGPPVQRVKWLPAKIWLDLVPLPGDVDAQFVKDTTKVVRDEKTDKVTDVHRDINKYAQLVGNYCIKGWGPIINGECVDGPGGVVDGNKQPLECNEQGINGFMIIPLAQRFVFEKVQGIDLYITEEITEAKND